MQAYYLEAKNPADLNTLIELADNIGLNQEVFIADMASPAVNQELLEKIQFTQKLKVKGFPPLLLENNGLLTNITHNYQNAKIMLDQIMKIVV